MSDGTVLKQTKQVKTGDRLTTRLKDGWVESEVKQIAPVKKRGPESLRPLNQRNKFHPFFEIRPCPCWQVIHRAARLQHLQRLVAFRAAGLEGKHPFALGAMRATAFDI